MPCESCGGPSVSQGICQVCTKALAELAEIKRVQGYAIVQYFDGNSAVGERKLYCCGVEDSGHHASCFWPHTAYFCPTCGELWGRAVFQYQFDYEPFAKATWVVESRHCTKHGDGQFLVGIPVDNCSADLLHRELSILLERTQNA